MRGRRKKFRVGQRVQSIYDATHTFVIDKSMVPDRIYHEKGTDRWWTKNELQELGAAEKPETSFRLNGKAKCVQMRGKCVAVVSERPTLAVGPRPRFPERECLGCGTVFQPKREWQRFHSTSCRYAYWNKAGRENATTLEHAL